MEDLPGRRCTRTASRSGNFLAGCQRTSRGVQWRKCFSEGLFGRIQHVKSQEDNRESKNKQKPCSSYTEQCGGFRRSNKREISEGWKCEGEVLGKSQPRALDKGAR